MTGRILSTWTDHDSALREILARADRSIDVFDKDLQRLPFEAKEQAEILRQFLVAADDDCASSFAMPNPFATTAPG